MTGRLLGNADTLVYLGGNEPSTHKYISELLGKETLDTRNRSVSRAPTAPVPSATSRRVGS